MKRVWIRRLNNIARTLGVKRWLARRTVPACRSNWQSPHVKEFDMETSRTLPVPTTGEGRIIEHLGCAVDYHLMKEHVTPLEFYRAVGYLEYVEHDLPARQALLQPKGDGEITASCHNEAGELGYCIGAVFNDTTKQFGFHS